MVIGHEPTLCELTCETIDGSDYKYIHVRFKLKLDQQIHVRPLTLEENENKYSTRTTFNEKLFMIDPFYFLMQI